LRAGHRAGYRVRGLVPRDLARGRYVVVVCVRMGNRRAGCRTAPRRLRVARPAPPASPVAPPADDPAPPATVAPPATEAPGVPGGGGGGGAPPPTPGLVVRDGFTQRAFAYGEAIRQKVWVQTDVDTDQD